MTTRKTSILDKIGSLIPNYIGYAERDEKRNSDKKLREHLASLIQNAENKIISHQKELITKLRIDVCTEWEITRKSLNTVKSKIKNTSYGESSFFSENQLKELELDEIYSFDLEIAERVYLILKTVMEEINNIMSPGIILKQLEEIENSLMKRANFINQHK